MTKTTNINKILSLLMQQSSIFKRKKIPRKYSQCLFSLFVFILATDHHLRPIWPFWTGDLFLPSDRCNPFQYFYFHSYLQIIVTDTNFITNCPKSEPRIFFFTPWQQLDWLEKWAIGVEKRTSVRFTNAVLYICSQNKNCGCYFIRNIIVATVPIINIVINVSVIPTLLFLGGKMELSEPRSFSLNRFKLKSQYLLTIL